MRLHVGQKLVVDTLRGFAQCEFAQRSQVAGGEIVGQSPFGGLWA